MRASSDGSSTLSPFTPSTNELVDPLICLMRICLISLETAFFFSLSMICTRALKRARTGRWSEV